MNWTKEQQKVIDLNNRNILVSAAAGSGKTAVLVERIIQKVINEEHPIDIDRMLIVTFTKAAASEMRERIGKALEKKLMENPDNLHLQKQMTLVHSAQITTIHSFCKSLISNYFSVIDLDPGIRLVDEIELQLLKTDVVSELLEAYYEKGEPEFLHFIEAYSTGKTDDGLEELILQLYNFSISHPWPKEWLEEQKASMELETVEDMEQSDWMKFLMDYICRMLQSLPKKCERALNLCREVSGPLAYEPAVRSDFELVESLCAQDSYEALYQILSHLQWEKLKRVSKKDEIDEDLQNEVKELRNDVKSAVDEIRKKFFFQSVDEMFYDLNQTKEDMQVLLQLAMDFYDKFQEEKLSKKVMDFNDLEHYALKILVKGHTDHETFYSDVANELSEYYDEIMIDEYQDSNHVQELLLTSISKERFGTPNIFMVGDVKQSIYKFRLAKPELFMNKFETYQLWKDGDSLYQRIDLHKNFRSRSIVLDFTNFIFEQIMQKKLGNIDYDKDAALYPGAVFEETNERISDSVEVLMVCGDEELDDEILEENEEQTGRELEARAIAHKIKELMGQEDNEECLKVFDGERKEYRNVMYKDIVILLRTVSGWAEDFVSVLGEEGIPAISDTQRGYFSAVEVKTVLNVLQIIDNPKQDIPLAAVLHSKMFSFSSEDLAEIRAAYKEDDFYTALLFYSENGEKPSLKKALNDFLNRINLYRSMMPYTSIRKIIEFILEDTGYYEYVRVMPAGEQRSANLDMLLKKAEDFEATSYKGLFQFNRYIEKLHKYDIDFGEAFISKDGVNAVRIMSIHKSKGLEFPVVFVSGLGKTFNMQDSRSKLIVHEELGLGADFVDIELRMKKVTLRKRAIQTRIKVENLGEELRVLYVALTRAKEKLILTGYDKKLMKKLEAWQKERTEFKLDYLALTQTSSYFGWIGPCLYYPNHLPIQIMQVNLKDLIVREAYKQAATVFSKEELLTWDDKKVFSQDLKDMIATRLNFSYPYSRDKEIPVKYTVSELKRRRKETSEQDESYQLYKTKEQEVKAEGEAVMPIPKFMSSVEVTTPVEKGILYHKVMQEIQFGRIKQPGDIEDEVKRMVSEEIITDEEQKSIHYQKFIKFFETDLAKQMANAYDKGLLYREKQFVIGVSARELPLGFTSDELVLIQGVVDAYIEDEEGLVLVDYKTDFIKRGGEEAFISQYKGQIVYYQTALEKITGKKVKEKYLYSFYLDKWFQIS